MSSHPPSDYLLDASALLAVLLGELGSEQVSAILERSSIHTVNVAEVIQKLVREGVPREEALLSVEELQLHIIPELTLSEAALCGELIATARKQGLGLGDCICLIVAGARNAIAVTGERLWKTFEGYMVGSHALRVQSIR